MQEHRILYVRKGHVECNSAEINFLNNADAANGCVIISGSKVFETLLCFFK